MTNSTSPSSSAWPYALNFNGLSKAPPSHFDAESSAPCLVVAPSLDRTF